MFSKGEEWLEAYEKYLENGKLQLALEQMKLTEEEKKVEQKNEQIYQHVALAAIQRWHLFAVTSDILSRRLPVTVDEVRNAQERMHRAIIPKTDEDSANNRLAEMFRLQCAITECSFANPGCDVNVGFTVVNGEIRLNVTPIQRRSLDNN